MGETRNYPRTDDKGYKGDGKKGNRYRQGRGGKEYFGKGKKDKEGGQGDREGKQPKVIWVNASLSDSDLTIYTIPATIHTIQENSRNESQHINARLLFDSGAIPRDLVSQRTVNSLLVS